MWSMERWKIWKDQFVFVSQDERFYPESRRVAALAIESMNALEGETGPSV